MFTTQQLQGGPRYGTRTRLGNWSEEDKQRELTLQDFERRSEGGSLLRTKKERERDVLTRPVQFAAGADSLHYGDVVQLCSGSDANAAPRYLSASIFESTDADPSCFSVYAVAQPEPQARSSFLLLRGDSPTTMATADGPLRFGDCVVLVSHPLLTTDDHGIMRSPFYLHSSGANGGLTGAGRRAAQAASVTREHSPAALWRLVHPSGDRLETDGSIVAPGSDIVLTHVMSNTALALGATGVSSGVLGDAEFAAADVNAVPLNRETNSHVSMKHDRSMPARRASPAVTWRIEGGRALSGGEPVQGMNAISVAREARGKLRSTGGWHGLRSLHTALSMCDRAGEGIITADDARAALVAHLPLDAAELQLLVGNDARLVRIPALLEILRGVTYSSARAAVVRRVWLALSAAAAATGESSNTSGGLTLPFIVKRFDPAFDPRVVSGVVTKQEALSEFQRQWRCGASCRPSRTQLTEGRDSAYSSSSSSSSGGGGGGGGIVGGGQCITASNFEEYYRDVAACVGAHDDNDDSGADPFVSAVASVWHLPGEGSWKGLRSKLVLVSKHNGSSVKAVIPNGESIRDDDFAALSAALRGQGFGGIARIKVLGLSE